MWLLLDLRIAICGSTGALQNNALPDSLDRPAQQKDSGTRYFVCSQIKNSEYTRTYMLSGARMDKDWRIVLALLLDTPPVIENETSELSPPLGDGRIDDL